ncbi:MAG: tRNA glutamyl-Q(34) synthetase GluQRS [Alphaproteobacteria bacterium]|nr:tRNA glutamyl-Q(34) synthetase GluQRS [Alphaproteobacteria bacterium]MDE2353356.1 tRNA glutamyl-Q(34) synthetase GluQRS [Alphaproteobacteria bacterium]
MIVTRFAPSPTGYLHLGHAFAAITAHDAAKAAANGRFLLRIEDLDSGRCRPEYEAAIYEDLGWLGLSWETPVLCQSSRAGAYREALARLEAMGLTYPCFCTRKDIAEEIARSIEAPHLTALGPEGFLYPGTCRALPEDARRKRMAREPYALRLDVAKAVALAGPLSFEEHGAGPNGERGIIPCDPTLFGDIVLARKQMPAAYHLAVVVDDAFQGVSLVTRGNDLFSATHVQRLLQALLGLPVPAYAHHRLVLDEQGKKFSKRDGAVTLRHLRETGMAPESIRRRLGL